AKSPTLARNQRLAQVRAWHPRLSAVHKVAHPHSVALGAVLELVLFLDAEHFPQFALGHWIEQPVRDGKPVGAERLRISLQRGHKDIQRPKMTALYQRGVRAGDAAVVHIN